MAPATPAGSPGPTILAGIDGGPGSVPVLRAAARMAAMADADLVVAHVAAAPQFGAAAYLAYEESALIDVEADIFPDVVETLLGFQVPWTLVTAAGNPALELIRLAEERGAAAIVVGADTPGWTSHLRRLSTGSVPSRLAHEQAAPVVIVPSACARMRSKPGTAHLG